MRIGFVCLVLGVLLVPAAAHADSHNADFYGGASAGGGGSTLKGFVVGLGKDVDREDSDRWWTPGVVGGAGVQFGGHDASNRDITQVVWGVGPRLTIAKPDWRQFIHAQFQVVGVYTNDGLFFNKEGHPAPNDLGYVVGAGYDYVFSHGLGSISSAVITRHPGLGIRVEADRVFNHGDRSSVWRLSAGVIYRAPKVRKTPTP
jgi:hypothetical protein